MSSRTPQVWVVVGVALTVAAMALAGCNTADQRVIRAPVPTSPPPQAAISPAEVATSTGALTIRLSIPQGSRASVAQTVTTSVVISTESTRTRTLYGDSSDICEVSVRDESGTVVFREPSPPFPGPLMIAPIGGGHSYSSHAAFALGKPGQYRVSAAGRLFVKGSGDRPVAPRKYRTPPIALTVK